MHDSYFSVHIVLRCLATMFWKNKYLWCIQYLGPYIKNSNQMLLYDAYNSFHINWGIANTIYGYTISIQNDNLKKLNPTFKAHIQYHLTLMITLLLSDHRTTNYHWIRERKHHKCYTIYIFLFHLPTLPPSQPLMWSSLCSLPGSILHMSLWFYIKQTETTTTYRQICVLWRTSELFILT